MFYGTYFVLQKKKMFFVTGMASIGEANLLRITGGLIRPLPGGKIRSLISRFCVEMCASNSLEFDTLKLSVYCTGNGPVNERRMTEVRAVLNTVQAAFRESYGPNGGRLDSGAARIEAGLEFVRGIIELSQDSKRREEAAPVLAEIQNVIQLVAVEVLEIRGARAMRSALNLFPRSTIKT